MLSGAPAPISPRRPGETSALRKRFRHLVDILSSPISIAFGLVLWEIGSHYVGNPLFLAAPSQIVMALIHLSESGELQHHIWISGIEFVLGYVIGCVAGVLLGFVMWASNVTKRALDPWISGFYATPTVALAPLFILWTGIGISSKVFTIVTLVIFPVTINTEAGLNVVSERLIDTFRAFEATRRQIFLKLALPSALPFILTGLKLAIGRALIGVVVAELFGSRAGIGS
jgi:NitT/TauT family transport system permease protein